MRRTLLTAVIAGASASSAPRRDDLWSLRGRRAVVTGGSKGLGRAIVEELLAQGCDVLTCARDLEPLAALLAAEPRLTAVAADVATAAGRRALVDAINERFAEGGASGGDAGGGASGGSSASEGGNSSSGGSAGESGGAGGGCGRGARLDLLVNNVGSNLRKASVDYSDDDYSRLHETNQASAFHLSRMCFGALARARGSVVCVSSVAGGTVDSTGAPYHMTKAAMEHMTRYLACEWGPSGVRVNAVAPWFIRTSLTLPLLDDPPFAAAVRRATPLRRWGEGHEVACAVAFLAMPAAGYISGAVIPVDGGMMCQGFRYEA